MKTSQIIILLSFPMQSIDFETLLVTVFVIVDDWSQKAVPPGNHLPGVKPKLSESEILTLALMMDYLPFPGETQFLERTLKGVFHEIQNTGCNPERLLNKTIEGFTTHIAAKIASHTLRILLHCQYGIYVLTFRAFSV